MKARRSTVLTLMAASLVTGSAVGVAAQADDGVEYDPLSSLQVERGGYGNVASLEYDPLSSIRVPTVDAALPAPVEFVGKWEFGEPLIPEASQTVAGITQNRGGVWRAVSEGMELTLASTARSPPRRASTSTRQPAPMAHQSSPSTRSSASRTRTARGRHCLTSGSSVRASRLTILWPTGRSC